MYCYSYHNYELNNKLARWPRKSHFHAKNLANLQNKAISRDISLEFEKVQRQLNFHEKNRPYSSLKKKSVEKIMTTYLAFSSRARFKSF